MTADRRLVTLHIGTPKSGTTFLQRELSRHRELLREHGYLYPGENPSHFIEVMSLRRRGFRGHEFEAAEGAWERVAAEVNAFDGPALISHEMLGGSDVETIQRGVDSFPGRPVRVVVTCRDLGRQLPAVWQEGVKNGDTERYEEFLTEAFAEWKGPASRKGVWAGQNLAGLGRRWGQVVGNDNVCFVTVPPAGAGTDDLWRRFAEAVGLPDADYALPEKPGNPSLGTVETELLRRFTERLPDDLPWPRRSRLVKRRFAQRRLVAHHTGGFLTVPEDRRDDTREVAGVMLEEIRAGGFRVVGDLADLDPSFRSDGTLPDQVGDDQLLSLALDLLVPLVLADDPGQRRAVPEKRQGDAQPSEGSSSLLARVGRRLRG